MRFNLNVDLDLNEGVTQKSQITQKGLRQP